MYLFNVIESIPGSQLPIIVLSDHTLEHTFEVLTNYQRVLSCKGFGQSWRVVSVQELTERIVPDSRHLRTMGAYSIKELIDSIKAYDSLTTEQQEENSRSNRQIAALQQRQS